MIYRYTMPQSMPADDLDSVRNHLEETELDRGIIIGVAPEDIHMTFELGEQGQGVFQLESESLLDEYQLAEIRDYHLPAFLTTMEEDCHLALSGQDISFGSIGEESFQPDFGLTEDDLAFADQEQELGLE